MVFASRYYLFESMLSLERGIILKLKGYAVTELLFYILKPHNPN